MKHLLISIVGMLSIYTSNAQQVIDVHCHNIFPEFTEFLERHGAAMKETFPLPQWDIDTHLEFMEMPVSERLYFRCRLRNRIRQH